ncbi:MAG: ABC transporter permease [Chloroflexi bacterium]|nr:ABC transporter permease [Chloroflexota bacterium]
MLHENYMRTAEAKGLTPGRVNFVHALRNALAPVLVYIFLTIPWLLGGAVVIETIFAFPGVGRLMFQSILNRDVPVVQGDPADHRHLDRHLQPAGDIVTAQLDPRVRY